MLELKGNAGKLTYQGRVLAMFFDWEANVDAGETTITAKKYWFDNYAPRVQFAACELYFGKQMLKCAVDMKGLKMFFDRLVLDTVVLPGESVQTIERS